MINQQVLLSIFARDYTDLSIAGFIIPIGWLQFANPIFVVTFAPIFAGIWAHLGRMNMDPSLPLKFAIGLIFMALSFIVMVYAVKLAMVSAPVGMQWLLITYLLQTWGELALSPIGLSAFSKYSPKKYMGQMFGFMVLSFSYRWCSCRPPRRRCTVDGLNSVHNLYLHL